MRTKVKVCVLLLLFTFSILSVGCGIEKMLPGTRRKVTVKERNTQHDKRERKTAPAGERLPEDPVSDGELIPLQASEDDLYKIYSANFSELCEQVVDVAGLKMSLPNDWELLETRSEDDFTHERYRYGNPAASPTILDIDVFDFEELDRTQEFADLVEATDLDTAQNRFFFAVVAESGRLEELQASDQLLGVRHGFKVMRYQGIQEEDGCRVEGAFVFYGDRLYDFCVITRPEDAIRGRHLINKILGSQLSFEAGVAIDMFVEDADLDRYPNIPDTFPEEVLLAGLRREVLASYINPAVGTGVQIALQNANPVPVRLFYNAAFYDAGRKVYSVNYKVHRKYITLGPGEQTQMALMCPDEADEFELTFECEQMVNDWPTRVPLSMELQVVQGGVEVTGRNATDIAVDFPVADCFFFDGGELVYCISMPLTDTDGQWGLAPGEDLVGSAEVPVDFDEVSWDYSNMPSF